MLTVLNLIRYCVRISISNSLLGKATLVSRASVIVNTIKHRVYALLVRLAFPYYNVEASSKREVNNALYTIGLAKEGLTTLRL